MTIHPFDSVQESEIRTASRLIKEIYTPSDNVHFVQIDRCDPPKKDMLKYLDAERHGGPRPQIPRVLYVYYYTNTYTFNKALVNVTVGHVITRVQLPKGVQGPILPDDMAANEAACMEHPRVKEEIEKLRLPKGYSVRTDPWIYATDDEYETRPLIQFYMYVAAGYGHSESNHYSLPLKFSPVFENLAFRFVRMDYLPGGFDETTTPTLPWQEVPSVEYHPDLNGETIPRDVKPLIVTQPEGPSFSVEGSKIKWQGWEFRVVPSVREGFAVYDAWFKGRQVFYRLSLSEMTVPYGDPRKPYHRKQAFDLGDCGFGVNANQLKLGCDCLGVIKYLDGMGINGNGEPILLGSTICLHEQDNGVLYKHLNYRTGNAVVARRREFVVQTIATVANYEYVVNLKFVTDGSIDVEVRATGILSTMPIDANVKVPWGTIVGPNVMAAYHQHILSFRLDPAVDGHNNTVIYEDAVKMPVDEKTNPFGTGFVTKNVPVEKAGYVEQAPFENRTVKIINENVINPISKTPVGYKLAMPAKQMLMANENTFNHRRAKYATEQVWVTKYNDNQLYAAGEFTNQSKTDTGIAEWANGIDNVKNDDIVVWPTLAFTHIPRVEDFPVMPVEIHSFHLVPFNFFDRNPTLDIPLANNQFNKSAYYNGTTTTDNTCCQGKKSNL